MKPTYNKNRRRLTDYLMFNHEEWFMGYCLMKAVECDILALASETEEEFTELMNEKDYLVSLCTGEAKLFKYYSNKVSEWAEEFEEWEGVPEVWKNYLKD